MSTTPSNEHADHEERFMAALSEFRTAALVLSRRWENMPADCVENYPPFLPSFDEAASAFQSMRLKPRWDERGAHLALTQDVNGWDFGGLPISYASAAPGIPVLQIDLDGEAFIWVSENLAGGDGWQCCLYLGGDHEGFYLTGHEEYPTEPEQLRQTVADLIAVRDETAAVYDALFGLNDGDGVHLVLREGGVLTGTICTDSNDARRGWVTVETSRGARKTRTLTEIRKVQAI